MDSMQIVSIIACALSAGAVIGGVIVLWIMSLCVASAKAERTAMQAAYQDQEAEYGND